MSQRAVLQWAAEDHKRDMTMLRKFWEDESGATAIEYGLLAALIAVAAIVALESVGNELTTTFSTVSTTMSDANSS